LNGTLADGLYPKSRSYCIGQIQHRLCHQLYHMGIKARTQIASQQWSKNVYCSLSS